MIEFSKNLRSLRKELLLSQKQLAVYIGVQAYTIGDWERERSFPDLQSLIALADFFKCSIDYLVGRENEMGIIEIVEKKQ